MLLRRLLWCLCVRANRKNAQKPGGHGSKDAGGRRQVCISGCSRGQLEGVCAAQAALWTSWATVEDWAIKLYRAVLGRVPRLRGSVMSVSVIGGALG